MDYSKAYSKKSFMVVLFFMILLIACLDVGLYYFNSWLLSLPAVENSSLNLIAVKFANTFSYELNILMENFLVWVIPFSLLFALLFTILIWLVLKVSVSGLFNKINDSLNQIQNQPRFKKDSAEQRIEQERKKRLFFHFMSILQREGRLIDFFDEDLSLYNDEQIGAAVRSIQEDCKKAVKKFIDPKPIFDLQEGDSITIEENFDLESVKLTGNVSGQPPFIGILRHRGWKAGKKDIPKLSDVKDSTVLVPAEVEIE